MLSRKNSQYLAVTLLVSLLGGLILAALFQSPEQSERVVSVDTPVDFSFPEVTGQEDESVSSDEPSRPIVIENFQRSFRKDGEIAWSAEGARAFIFSARGELLIESGIVRTQSGAGRPIEIQAGEARIEFNQDAGAGQLKQAMGSNGVVIISEDVRMETPSATLDTENDVFSGSESVVFLSERMRTEGEGFTFDIGENILDVGGRVKTRIEPGEGSS